MGVAKFKTILKYKHRLYFKAQNTFIIKIIHNRILNCRTLLWELHILIIKIL